MVLNLADSYEKHLRDTLIGGQYISNRDMARSRVEEATPTVKEISFL